MKAPLRILSDEQLRTIHNASLTVLEETGMMVDHENAREVLQAAGASVNHDTKIVKFPGHLVEEKLKLVPRKVTYHGRTPEFDFTVESGGEIYSRVAGGAMNYIDLKSGKSRRACLADWVEFARLVDALPNIHCVCTMHCGDVSEATADIHGMRVLLENQRKCIIHTAFTLRIQQYLLELALAVRGSKQALAERPLYHHMLSPISPLFLDEDSTAQLFLACDYGLPTDIPIMPISGFTAPITLAGTLVQANAEFLGTMTLAQTYKPGHVMPYFTDPVVADLRTSAPLFAAPEVGLLVAAISQLGSELYGLAPQGIGLDSDGYVMEQSLFQKAQNTIFQCMAGGKLIIGAGAVEACMALNPAQLVIDDEIMHIARRWVRSIEVNENTLAVDVIRKVGPRGQFLTEEHTLNNLRTGELVTTEIFERDRRELWEAKGSKSLEQKAREKGLALLAKHQVPPLPEEVLRELAAIVKRADNELAK
jgi:trimethylamine--corrinoid protein Co-methyltransferase